MSDPDAEIAALMTRRADAKARPPARDYSYKLCICCRLIMPKNTSFRPMQGTKDGLSDVCVTCERRTALPPNPPAPKPRPRWKICTKCKQARPIAQYSANKRGTYGLRAHCKPCCAAVAQARRQRLVDTIGIDAARAQWRANVKADRARDPDHYNKLCRDWRKAHPERNRATNARCYAKNRDKILAGQNRRRHIARIAKAIEAALTP